MLTTATPNSQAVAKSEVANHFSTIAQVYNDRNYVKAGRRAKYPDIAIRHRYFLEMLEGVNGRALEIGCGSGQMLHDLLQRGFEVVGVDIAPGMIASSRALIKGSFPQLEPALMIGDIEHLALPDEHFDVVLAAGVIEYLSSDLKSFREIRRVLKPGGIVLLSVRNRINLSRWITTSRDLLESMPLAGKVVTTATDLARSFLSLPPNGGIPGRRHAPAALQRDLRRAGLLTIDSCFYHFAVFPRPVERQFGEFCSQCGQKLEVLRRTPLGYLANQYIVKARKVY